MPGYVLVHAQMSRSAKMTFADIDQQFRPVTVSIAECRRISGYSRSEIYRQLAAGKFKAVKAGSRTLIVLDSLINHLNSLPPATFRAPRVTVLGRGEAR